MPAKKKATKKKVVKKAANKDRYVRVKSHTKGKSHVRSHIRDTKPKVVAKVTAKKKAVAKQKPKRTKKEPQSKVLPVMMEQHFEIVGLRIIVQSLRNGIIMLMILGLLFLAILMSDSNKQIDSLQAQLDNCSSNLYNKTLCEQPPEGYFSGTEGAIRYNECLRTWIATNQAPEFTTIE